MVFNNDHEISSDSISVIVTPLEMNNALPIYAAVFDGSAATVLSKIFHDILEKNIADMLELAINGQRDLQAISLPSAARPNGLYLR